MKRVFTEFLVFLDTYIEELSIQRGQTIVQKSAGAVHGAAVAP